MSDECGCLLKRYAAMFNVTQDSVLYEAARAHIHKQALAGCQATKNLLDDHCIKLDKRTPKDCYGFQCIVCKHDKSCRIGQYQGPWECAERYKHLLILDTPIGSPIPQEDS